MTRKTPTSTITRTELIKLRHGQDFYTRIGRLGGLSSPRVNGFDSKSIDKNGLTGHDRAVKYASNRKQENK